MRAEASRPDHGGDHERAAPGASPSRARRRDGEREARSSSLRRSRASLLLAPGDRRGMDGASKEDRGGGGG
jgi:hypothetical protein